MLNIFHPHDDVFIPWKQKEVALKSYIMNHCALVFKYKMHSEAQNTSDITSNSLKAASEKEAKLAIFHMKV